MAWKLEPGSKIGRNMTTGKAPDPAQNGYGTLGCFMEREGREDLFILTNGHVVDWTPGQDVYCYKVSQSMFDHFLHIFLFFIPIICNRRMEVDGKAKKLVKFQNALQIQEILKMELTVLP